MPLGLWFYLKIHQRSNDPQFIGWIIQGDYSKSLMHASAKWLQLYLTLCDPMDCGPPGSSVHGFLQARILECIAISSSRGSSQARDPTHTSCSPALAGGFFTISTTREGPVSQDLFKRALAKLNACRRAGGPLLCQLLGLGSSSVAGKGQDSWGGSHDCLSFQLLTR